jgi:HAD superfamily hydrolase (TIGR01509 family)
MPSMKEQPMDRLTIFLDDGGVMNDNERRGPAWQRLISAFLAPRLGGDPAGWMTANRIVAERQFADYTRTMSGRTDLDVAAYLRANQVEWLTGMCALVGVPAPPADECLALAEATAAYVTPRVDAAFPGAVAAIRQLHAAGYTLHTASGEWQADLHGYLTGMAVRDLFGNLYGTDRINTFKQGPAYYTRIFADAGVAPAAALVVDDSPAAVGWARAAGARAVLVGVAGGAPVLSDAPAIGSLADLPALLAP